MISRNKREGWYCGKARGRHYREGACAQDFYTRLRGKFLYEHARIQAIKLGWIPKE